MRHFQYQNYDKSQREMKKAIDLASENHKHAYRKERTLEILMFVMFAILFVLGLVGVFMLADAVFPVCKTVFEKMLDIIVTALIRIIGVIGTFILAGLAVLPLGKKAIQISRQRRQYANSIPACAHLRAYYGVKEPYLITKCYEDSGKRFENKDICLFVSDGELRITKDLIKGFLHAERDVGCYTMTSDEISLKTVSHIKIDMLSSLPPVIPVYYSASARKNI